MNLAEKRATWNGFGDGLSKAFEMAATPAIFGFIGWFIDGAVGTHLVFTIGLGVFAMVGMFVRSWYAYDAEMTAQESGGVWNRGRRQ